METYTMTNTQNLRATEINSLKYTLKIHKISLKMRDVGKRWWMISGGKVTAARYLIKFVPFSVTTAHRRSVNH